MTPGQEGGSLFCRKTVINTVFMIYDRLPADQGGG